MNTKNINIMNKNDIINAIGYIMVSYEEQEDDEFYTVSLIKEMHERVRIRVTWPQNFKGDLQLILECGQLYRHIDFMVLEEFRNIFDEIHKIYKKLHPYLIKWQIINKQNDLENYKNKVEEEKQKIEKDLETKEKELIALEKHLEYFIKTEESGIKLNNIIKEI